MKYLYLLTAVIALYSATCKKNTDKSAVSNTSGNANTSTTKSTKKNKAKVEFIDTVLNWVDFESGYAKAVAENKKILVDVYTDWCGWCKVMDKKTYTDDSVIYYINKYFVAVKLNPEIGRTYSFHGMQKTETDLHAWLGNGMRGGYPTTYFITDPGKTDIRASAEGYIETPSFLQILKSISKN